MSRSLNNTEVPELRFSEFDKDWNELKLNKLIQLLQWSSESNKVINFL